ncbi:Fasciclin domain-containing protein [Kalaharituber pfeilii]|nr:Fasciclin domain-containing protein [Kalaharituber pfeilii]
MRQLTALIIFLPLLTNAFVIPDLETFVSRKELDRTSPSPENLLETAFERSFSDAPRDVMNAGTVEKLRSRWEQFPAREWVSGSRAVSSMPDGMEAWLKDVTAAHHHRHHGDHDLHDHRPDDGWHPGYDRGIKYPHDRSPHNQPHSDHGHDGYSGHHPISEIPMPDRDGRFYSNSTIWDLIKECKYTSIFAHLAKEDTEFLNLLKDPHQNITLFVPTDHAFKRILPHGKLPEKGIPHDLLYKLLNYHTTVGTLWSKELRRRNTLVHGPSVNFFADILVTDIRAVSPARIEDILDLLPTEFSTTLSALYKTKLVYEVPKLTGEGLTVFAPSNRDWEKLGWKTTAFLFSDAGKHYLKALMKYHIVPNVSLYSDAFDRPKDSKSSHRDLPHAEKHYHDYGHIPQGYQHIDLQTLLDDKKISVDITRYERFLSFRVNGHSRVIFSDGIAKDGVVQVPNHVLIPPHSEEEHSEGGSIWEAQRKGEEVDVEELKRVLEPHVQEDQGVEGDMKSCEGRRVQEIAILVSGVGCRVWVLVMLQLERSGSDLEAAIVAKFEFWVNSKIKLQSPQSNNVELSPSIDVDYPKFGSLEMVLKAVARLLGTGQPDVPAIISVKISNKYPNLETGIAL